jgi:ribosomal protein L11 methyltransferase
MKVDWRSQWQEHAPHFANGYAHVDLQAYGKEGFLRLHPGAGFGDCSHPTTRLVLRLLSGCTQGRHIIDIGSGSGILSLAALVWGASSSLGIDIDEEALEHAKLNGQLNQLPLACFTRNMQKKIGKHPLIVMNMISSEQRLAWQEHPALHPLTCPVITSGILLEEREYYLGEVARLRGWHLIKELQEDEWLAFLFEQK